MKFTLALVLLGAAVALAKPAVDYGPDVKSLTAKVGPEGYEFSYELVDGTRRVESGVQSGDNYEVKGDWSYKAPEGMTISQTFVANDGGFQPKTKIAL